MFLATEDNVTTPCGCLNMFLAISLNAPTPRTSPPSLNLYKRLGFFRDGDNSGYFLYILNTSSPGKFKCI